MFLRGNVANAKVHMILLLSQLLIVILQSVKSHMTRDTCLPIVALSRDTILVPKMWLPTWAEFWGNVSSSNQLSLRRLVDTLLPSLAGGYKSFFYTSDCLNQFNKAGKNIDKMDGWPDDSYSGWSLASGRGPSDGEGERKDVIMGTWIFQEAIWKMQHPTTCTDKKFNVVVLHRSGLGSSIHAHAYTLGMGLLSGFITVYSDGSYWTKGMFCSKTHGYDCFFKPMTNCSKITNRTKLERPLMPIRLYSTNRLVPGFVLDFLKKSLVPRDVWLWYWKIQLVTFMTRLNEKTRDWLVSRNKDLVGTGAITGKKMYDVTVYVRHGAKWREMLLIPAEGYFPALEVCAKLLDKDPNDLTVYLGTEDPVVIECFLNRNLFNISYIPMKRGNYDMSSMRKIGPALALDSLADLGQHLYSRMQVGTVASNWNRLVLELKQTMACECSCEYIEVGETLFLTPEHAHKFDGRMLGYS